MRSARPLAVCSCIGRELGFGRGGSVSGDRVWVRGGFWGGGRGEVGMPPIADGSLPFPLHLPFVEPAEGQGVDVGRECGF